MNVRIDILNVLRICGVNISGDVQVIPVLLFDLIIGYETSILGIGSNLLIEGRYDSIDITFTQSILIAILNVPTAGINHKDTLSVCSTFFINHEHAGSYAGAIKQVCWKADDALDPVLLNNCLSNGSFSISTKQNTMRKNDRSFTIRLQRFKDMHKPSIVSVLLRRCVTVTFEAAILFTGNAITPVFHRKWRISHYVIKTFKYGIIRFIKVLRIRKCIAALDGNFGLTVQNGIHLSKTGCRAFFLLTITHDRKWSRVDSPDQ